ncbi:MAG TPA: oxidoreductase [Steroidobacter sp.]|nr:oxidoreductase [Steroidobacter sp.]
MSQPKVWFITGAARGIGAEIVKAALEAGDHVVATGRNRDQIAATCKDHGDRVLAVELDVSKELHAFAAVETAVARFGRIDVLVNNAGYGQLGLFEEISAAEIQKQYDTNVFGAFNVTRAVLPVLRKQRSGHIFNISSMGGAIGFPYASIYCSSKFALEGFSESLALDVADFGIHVTIVEPGFTRTDFLDSTSVRHGSRQITGYEQISTKLKAEYDSYNHRQAGDPARLAAALLTLANSEHPPMRWASGSDSFERVTSKLAGMQAELHQYQQLSSSVDGVS